MDYAAGIQVTRLRRGTEPDPRTPGGTRPAPWENAEAVTLPNCYVAPTGSTAPTDPARQAVVTSMSLYGPYNMDVRPGDRIQDPAGLLWAVDTDPARHRNPFTGWEAGADVPVSRVKG